MIKFGTSGFRGKLGDNFTKEAVQKIAVAITKISKINDVVPIGYDNRFMGETFAKWVAEVLVANGKKVKFFKKSVPSPLIAYETKNTEFGVMISASHNPYYYNGIKLFQKGGRETTNRQNQKLEKIANKVNVKRIKTINFEIAVKEKKVILTENISPYINSLQKNVDKKAFSNSKVKVLCNVMNGSGEECVKNVFKSLGITVDFLNDCLDPYFVCGNGLPAPYEKNLQKQKQLIKANNYDFGFALDGDGDRVSFLDENGKFYNCNYISALVYENFLENGEKTDFVKNCAMTSLVDKIAEKNGQKIILAEVGFKNTADKMVLNEKVKIGAESNGIAIKDHLLYKDGIMIALLIAEIVAKTGKPLGKLLSGLKKKYKYPCEAVEYSYPFTDTQRNEIEKTVFVDKVLPKGKQKIVETSYADGLKITYENGYWGAIRFSGNENVIRLFAEMPNLEEAENLIKIYEKLIKLKTKQ